MRKISALLLAAYCIFAINTGASAQSAGSEKPLALTQPGFMALVEIVIDAPESIESVFQQCMVNELESLGDVMLTKDNPQYRITVMALPNKTRDEVIGFTFSILITRPLNLNALRPLLMSERIGDHDKRVLSIIGANYEKVEKTTLLTCPPEELGRVCSEIVAGFNRDLVEKDRHLWSSMLGIPRQPQQPQEGP